VSEKLGIARYPQKVQGNIFCLLHYHERLLLIPLSPQVAGPFFTVLVMGALVSIELIICEFVRAD